MPSFLSHPSGARCEWHCRATHCRASIATRLHKPHQLHGAEHEAAEHSQCDREPSHTEKDDGVDRKCGRGRRRSRDTLRALLVPAVIVVVIIISFALLLLVQVPCDACGGSRQLVQIVVVREHQIRQRHRAHRAYKQLIERDYENFTFLTQVLVMGSATGRVGDALP